LVQRVGVPDGEARGAGLAIVVGGAAVTTGAAVAGDRAVGGTVEPAFYARARSPLLVAARLLDAAAGPPALLLDDVAAARLATLRPCEAEARRVGETALAQIAQIAGTAPTVADIRDAGGWAGCVRFQTRPLAAQVYRW